MYVQITTTATYMYTSDDKLKSIHVHIYFQQNRNTTDTIRAPAFLASIFIILTGSRVLQPKVFVIKLLSVNRLATSAVVICKIATLAHLGTLGQGQPTDRSKLIIRT